MVEVQFVNGGKGRLPFLIPYAIIESFAVDASLHLIYFLDSSSNALTELNIINRQIRTLANNVVATDLIFDWIANLLAWIEPAQSTIRSFSITSGKTTLIYSGLQQPSSLTVDVHNGDLYWISGTSWKTIMRGNWNRNSPKTIVSEANLNSPTSLRYDVTSHRIYWLDNSMIKSSLINGSDIKSHLITFGATEALPYKDFFGWINGNKTYFAKRSAISAEYGADVIQNIKHMTIFDALLQQDRRGSCQILNGGCEGICVPLQNGRKCECDFGLQAKDLTCESSFFLKNFIIVLDYSHGRILQADINTGDIVKLPINIQNSPGITFDKSTMELIYSEVQTKTIMSTTLHGTNTSLISATGFAHADRLTIDYSTGNIYFTAVGSSQSQSYIGVIHRRSLLHKTLLKNLHSPREIAVYPSKGFLYWTAFGNITEISRSYMDGTSKMYIATTNIGWPNGLAIDFATNQIFWVDGLKNSIEYSDLNGGNRNALTTDSDAHLMSIVIHGQYLYYTAWNRQRITKMDKTTGAKQTFMPNHPELGRLDSLEIYADDTVDVNAICSKKNGNCSTFCFPTPTGRTCGCQDNVNLQADQKTCQGVSRCTSLPNINLLDCLAFPGETCEFECKPGFRRDVNTSITCNQLSQWDPPSASLCSEIFCSPSLTNAVLSSNCSRSVNRSCTFKCSEGYSRTTLQNLMCTMNGSWNLDTNSLCSRSSCSKTIQNGQFTNCSAKIGETCQYGCNSPFEINPAIQNVTCHTSREWSHDINNLCRSSCSKSIQNGQFIDCQSNIGETCQYECNSPFEINPSVPNVTCNSSSYWNHDPGDLCVRFCPKMIQNGELDPSCQRQIGNKCSFTCDINYKPTSQSITCTSGGTWNENTAGLCKQQSCPLEISNGNFSSLCKGYVGEKCEVTCYKEFKASVLHLVCTSTGTWDKDTNRICEKIKHQTISDEEDKTGLYIGILIACVVIVVIITVAILILRRRKPSSYQGGAYDNPAFPQEETMDRNRPEHVYDTADDMYMTVRYDETYMEPVNMMYQRT